MGHQRRACAGLHGQVHAPPLDHRPVRSLPTRTLTQPDPPAPMRSAAVRSPFQGGGSYCRIFPAIRGPGTARAAGRSPRWCIAAVAAIVLLPAVGPTPASGSSSAAASAPVVRVPAGIDATGSRDVSSALIAFIDSVPDGSTIAFRSGGIYRLDKAVKFARRHDLTFEGNGASLMAAGGTAEASSLIWLSSYGGGNSGITIRKFTLVGNSTRPGVFQSGREGAHGILIDGGTDTEVVDVTIRGVWGDCFYLGQWADHVWIHDSRCASSGRSGVTVTSAQNAIIERVAFDRIGYCTLNIEPNSADEGARSIKFRNNTAGTWSNSFFSAVGAPGSFVSGVTVSGNVVTGGSLLTVIDLPTGRRNITFINNTSRIRTAGPVLRFAHIDGLTIWGNAQPLSSGRLTVISNSTRVNLR